MDPLRIWCKTKTIPSRAPPDPSLVTHTNPPHPHMHAHAHLNKQVLQGALDRHCAAAIARDALVQNGLAGAVVAARDARACSGATPLGGWEGRGADGLCSAVIMVMAYSQPWSTAGAAGRNNNIKQASPCMRVM